jgi:L-ascorbate metabolism protein UlaG (beta-lactamase superfamily)
MTARLIEPERLDFIDVVTSSHRHTDHLDAATLQPLMRANDSLVLVGPEADRAFIAERLGCDPAWLVGLDQGQAVKVGPLTFHGIAAAHDEVERDEAGRCRYLGYVVTFEAGGRRRAVYHSGDTLWHPGLLPALDPFDLDVALLPINGHRPERRVAGNLFGDEAARLAHEAGANLVVPCHFEMFTFNTEPPDLFVETCRSLDQPHRVLRCGERLLWPPADS